jgi:hypothetical protein
MGVNYLIDTYVLFLWLLNDSELTIECQDYTCAKNLVALPTYFDV